MLLSLKFTNIMAKYLCTKKGKANLLHGFTPKGKKKLKKDQKRIH